jgi:hypothetical protein
MTSSFEFDPINRVVCWRLQGEVTEDLFVESVRLVPDILGDTNPKSGIIDFSLVTSFRVSADVIQRVADSEPVFPASFPRVIVAPADHVFGMARMFAVLSQDTRSNTHVVRTMDEAYELLRIKEPEFKAMGLRRRTGS